MKNIKDLYINFFIEKGHKQLPSAPIIPENDPTCLFNTAGMQPLVPYLMGKSHPLGTRLTSFQKCFRLTDLESVGDKTHHTFFEMLGNWSLGDYFKEESIAFSFEFLTKILNIPLERLAVTVFIGNEIVGKDTESAYIWTNLGISEKRIAYLGIEDNWWPNFDAYGPCGPDSEIFYWSDNNTPAPETFDPSDSRWVEIWNNVFMQYNHNEEGYKLLEKKNVDTGMGVERTTAVLAGVDDSYKTSIWLPIINKIEEISHKSYEGNEKEIRVVADHIRAVVMIAGDDANIEPSNTDQGYILRRLIRRIVRYAKKLEIDIDSNFEEPLVNIVIDEFGKYYSELSRNKTRILTVIKKEKEKFSKTLEKGLKEFEKAINNLANKEIPTDIVFKLYDTYGFPVELTKELAEEKGLVVDEESFKERFKKHQEISKQGSDVKFKGGLSSNSDMDTKYHTATHLLNAALKEVLGNHVYQKGSNITPERLRFDFPHQEKMNEEEISRTEDLVNKWIKESLEVTSSEIKKEEAIKSGAEATFTDRYGEYVTVYKIGDISKEICGGPHVKNTNELGQFKIIKEESSSAGVRRIKAILE